MKKSEKCSHEVEIQAALRNVDRLERILFDLIVEMEYQLDFYFPHNKKEKKK